MKQLKVLAEILWFSLPVQLLVNHFKRNQFLLLWWVFLFAIILIIFFVIVAAFAPIIAPPDERARDPFDMPRLGYSAEPQPPSPEARFGTTDRLSFAEDTVTCQAAG